MIGSIIPSNNISVMDSIPSTAPYRNDDWIIATTTFNEHTRSSTQTKMMTSLFMVYVSKIHVDRFKVITR